MIVKRTINGVTKRYVEVMKTFDFGGDTTAAFFVDSGLVYAGSATTTLSGLYHLEGETMSVLANGGRRHTGRLASQLGDYCDLDNMSKFVLEKAVCILPILIQKTINCSQTDTSVKAIIRVIVSFQ